jgi:hypothetical protein
MRDRINADLEEPETKATWVRCTLGLSRQVDPIRFDHDRSASAPYRIGGHGDTSLEIGVRAELVNDAAVGADPYYRRNVEVLQG